MKYKGSFDGIQLEVCGDALGPIHSKQRWEGTSEETKVLLHDEKTQIDCINIKIGGMTYEIEMTIEESIQVLKNFTELNKLIREEIKNWAFFFQSIEGELSTKDTPAAAEETEKTPEESVPVNKLGDIIADILRKTQK